MSESTVGKRGKLLLVFFFTHEEKTKKKRKDLRHEEIPHPLASGLLLIVA